MPYLEETSDPSDFLPVEDNCWFLTGPTASGKTAISLALAKRLDAEIISMDSMAIYRKMDIGTAKPTSAEQADVVHHLLDIVDPTEEFSIASYLDAAHRKIAEIRERAHQVLFVGGTPLYLKALLRGLFQGPPADWEFRRQVEEELKSVGVEALQQRLQQVDPLSAAKLHPNDKRRIIRALEVYRVTGQPISHLQTQFEEGLPADRRRVVCLRWARPQLHRRINQRVTEMFDAGFVEEVRGLLADGATLSRTASQAVGYREVISMLREGISLDSTIEATMTRTRQFARRQETWFRSLQECRFFDCAAADRADNVAEQIHSMILRPSR